MQTSNVALVITVAIFVSIIVFIIWYFTKSIDDYYRDFIQGFWVAPTINGQCIIHLDDNSIRIVETNEDERSSPRQHGKYDINSDTWWTMDQRKFQFKVSDLKGKPLSLRSVFLQQDLQLDLYPCEGVMILYDSSNDILTFTRDNQANISTFK